MRIGQGFDVHALVAGRRLIIGGVTIPYDKGLEGHSDADVLLHAICDALLGAAALGDIGRHFPDSDPAYKGADSRMLLREVKKRISSYRIVNIDATILAQAPRILAVPAGAINIKATTTEHLGFIGRVEGIAAQAIVLLEENSGSGS
jgi:2-C-methyl-D-erythritol 2,4-cyclodiphosphate synthase